MEEFKKWIKGHKALAIGGGIALVVLLYLWLRSGSSASTSVAGSSNAALGAYYSAEASSQQSAAEQVAAADQLQAEENQTNVQGSVATAEIQAQNAPYQAQLDELTQLSNLQAYQDYLGESANNGNTGSGTNSLPAGTLFFPTQSSGVYAIQEPGQNQPTEGIESGTSYSWDWITQHTPGSPNYQGNAANITGAGTTTLPAALFSTYNVGPAAQPTPVVQPGSFNGFSAPTL